MKAKIIDGHLLARKIKCGVLAKVREYRKRVGRSPSLAIIAVGDDPVMALYIKAKSSHGIEVGIQLRTFNLPNEVGENKVLSLIQMLNEQENTNGILVQLPLPHSMDRFSILEAIAPSKDVDGIHPLNIGYLAIGSPRIVPCAPRACLYLLKSVISSLVGANVVVIGSSALVGQPLTNLLLQESCSVTTLHERSLNIPRFCCKADVVVAAAGSPGLVRREWVKPGSTVIDVGINYSGSKGSVVGDVAFEEVATVAGHITPVPGGVGPVTVAMLLDNTIELACRQEQIYVQQPKQHGYSLR